MEIFKSSIDTLEEFIGVLRQLPEHCYSQPCAVLSDATIGQHTRHVVELYLCLLQGYDSSRVAYDQRKREKKLENDLSEAIAQLNYIQDHLKKPNKTLEMIYELDGKADSLPSNYYREVMYNLEHAIHHHALIKIGIQYFTEMELPDSFGVAPSTMQYRKACAQ